MGTPSGEVAMPVGPHDFTGKTDQAGVSPCASWLVHTSRPVVTVIGPLPSSCVHHSRASSGPTVVVTFGQLHLRSAPSPAPAGSTPVHQWFQRELGCSPPHSSDRGPPGHRPDMFIHSVLELLAVRLALQHFLPVVQGQLVMVITDSTTVIAQLHNQRGDAIKAPLQPHCSASALGRHPQH